ncbi:tetratricopeptide repeat protein, partial [candidate division WOR-3 bacterium]|nr:tetratricopeptide repeat protein [candidate division WOR-3 bacterium]MBD3364865.1 tetratricopeptide repeat protein [candidate division WOR-3 bacterium]
MKGIKKMGKTTGLFILLGLSATCGFADWNTKQMRPSVEPERIERLLDSLITMGDVEWALTKFVEDSLYEYDERMEAATLLAAYYNRIEKPARSLLALFYISRELETDWTTEQNLIAAEAYARLNRRDWSESMLSEIDEMDYLSDVSRTLHTYSMLEGLSDPDSLIEVRSQFERQLERTFDPMTLMLCFHGLGLCYLASGIGEHYDTAGAYFDVVLKEYPLDYPDLLPLLGRLIPYSLYWSGLAAARRGDGWTALATSEEILYSHPEMHFWDEAAIRYASLQMRREKLDSVRIAVNMMLERTTNEHSALEGKLLLASCLLYERKYDSAAVAFASLSRQLPVGDTLRVLAYSGLETSLLAYSRNILDVDSIIPRLTRLNLAEYNPLAMARLDCELAERFLRERRVDEADSFYNLTLRYYPDQGTRTHAHLGLAYTSLADGEWNRSIEHYEKAVEYLHSYEVPDGIMADIRLN